MIVLNKLFADSLGLAARLLEKMPVEVPLPRLIAALTHKLARDIADMELMGPEYGHSTSQTAPVQAGVDYDGDWLWLLHNGEECPPWPKDLPSAMCPDRPDGKEDDA